MKIGILGCGNWGSVFGIIQQRNGHRIKIWEFERARAERVQRTRDNRPFLHYHKLPRAIEISWDVEQVLAGADLVVFALPCQVLPAVIEELTRRKKKINARFLLSLIKGIDVVDLKRPSEIISRLPQAADRVCVLSGPSIANEIIQSKPTAVVLAGSEKNLAALQHELSTPRLRVYESRDLTGVELGGAIKNVLALAGGICDGLGLGANTRGALISRGIVEMQRLGTRLGGRASTFWGLSGLGDLITTASSQDSRNRRYGMLIGQGFTRRRIDKETVMVTEGVPTALAVKKLAERQGVETPICRAVYEVLYNNRSPRRGIQTLMNRPLTRED